MATSRTYVSCQFELNCRHTLLTTFVYKAENDLKRVRINQRKLIPVIQKPQFSAWSRIERIRFFPTLQATACRDFIHTLECGDSVCPDDTVKHLAKKWRQLNENGYQICCYKRWKQLDSCRGWYSLLLLFAIRRMLFSKMTKCDTYRSSNHYVQ